MRNFRKEFLEHMNGEVKKAAYEMTVKEASKNLKNPAVFVHQKNGAFYKVLPREFDSRIKKQSVVINIAKKSADDYHQDRRLAKSIDGGRRRRSTRKRAKTQRKRTQRKTRRSRKR